MEEMFTCECGEKFCQSELSRHWEICTAHKKPEIYATPLMAKGNQPESQVCKTCGARNDCQLHIEYDYTDCDKWISEHAYLNNPDPPEESQDERIREAFEKDYPTLPQAYKYRIDQYQFYDIFETGFKSRDAEVGTKNRVINSLEDQLRIANRKQDEYKEEIEIYIGKLTALRAQIEEMKCCGNCGWNCGRLPCGRPEVKIGGKCDNWKRRSE